MSLKLGKAERTQIAAVLDADHLTVEDAVDACLEVFEKMFAARAKFTVVGQLYRSPEDGFIDPSDPKAIKVALGWYSTEGDARAAAETLSIAHATHEQYRTWVLDVFHGSPAGLLIERKAKLQQVQEKRKEAQRERTLASIAKYEEKRQAEVYAAINKTNAA